MKVAVAAALHNAHYKRKGAIDHNAAAHDAGHPDHEMLRQEKMRAAMRGMQRDHAAEHMSADRLDRMGAKGREAKRGRPRMS